MSTLKSQGPSFTCKERIQKSAHDGSTPNEELRTEAGLVLALHQERKNTIQGPDTVHFSPSKEGTSLTTLWQREKLPGLLSKQQEQHHSTYTKKFTVAKMLCEISHYICLL